MGVDFGWTLNFLLIFTGMSLVVVAILLSTQLTRVKNPRLVMEWVAAMLIVGILFQIIALFAPQHVISPYWFVIAGVPFLFPALILSQAMLKSKPLETSDDDPPKAITSRSAPAEFNEQLTSIPKVLSENPEGLTLVEIGEVMGVEWRRLTGAASELIDSGRIKKEGKKYYLKKSSS